MVHDKLHNRKDLPDLQGDTKKAIQAYYGLKILQAYSAERLKKINLSHLINRPDLVTE